MLMIRGYPAINLYTGTVRSRTQSCALQPLKPQARDAVNPVDAPRCHRRRRRPLPRLSRPARADIIVQRDTGLSGAEQTEVRSDAGVKLVETLPIARTEVLR